MGFKKKSEYPVIILLLVPSLLLHLLLLFFFTHHNLADKQALALAKKLTHQKKKLPPAKVTLGSNNPHGTFFIQEPALPNPEKSSYKPEQKQKTIASRKPVKKPENKIKKKFSVKKEVKNVIKKQNIKTYSKPSPTILVKEEQIEIPKKKNILAKRIEQVLRTPSKPSRPKTKRKTLLAMTKGLINQVRTHGSNYERKGANRVMMGEELKHHQYDEQISWQWQSTWKQHYQHRRRRLTGKPVIAFIIGPNGELEATQLVRSSGNSELDELILESLQRSAPFPPIPSFFKEKRHTLKVTFVISN